MIDEPWKYYDGHVQLTTPDKSLYRVRGKRKQVRAIRRVWIPWMSITVDQTPAIVIRLCLRPIELGTKWVDWKRASGFWAVSLKGKTT